MGEKLLMTERERLILHELKNHIENKQKLKDSAQKCGLCLRQMQRKKSIYLKEGDKGLVHQSRGKPSGRAYSQEYKELVLNLYSEKYEGFGPTLASEKLFQEGYPVNRETLRLWLLKAGYWHKKKKRKSHRRQRERKRHFGELIQIDGSFHDWFSTGETHCMMVMVDDATGKSIFQLSKEETTKSAIELVILWIEKYGIPNTLYSDRKSVYHTKREASIEESLSGQKPLTQFGKCCAKLGINIIAAKSPQAKGRVERKNGVLQDRLVKEFKLQGITDIETANKFLLNEYIEDLDNKFSISPASETDYHRELTEGINLNEIFSLETERKVNNDWTVRNNNKIYQIDRKNTILPPSGSKVKVQQCLDGTLHIIYRGEKVNYTEIQKRSDYKDYQAERQKVKNHKVPTVKKPALNHPWRKPFLPVKTEPRVCGSR